MSRTRVFRWTSLAAGTTVAMVVAGLATYTAGAAEAYHCNGRLVGNSNHEQLVVPAGARCLIDPDAHVKVSGA